MTSRECVISELLCMLECIVLSDQLVSDQMFDHSMVAQEKVETNTIYLMVVSCYHDRVLQVTFTRKIIVKNWTQLDYLN